MAIALAGSLSRGGGEDMRRRPLGRRVVWRTGLEGFQTRLFSYFFLNGHQDVRL